MAMKAPGASAVGAGAAGRGRNCKAFAAVVSLAVLAVLGINVAYFARSSQSMHHVFDAVGGAPPQLSRAWRAGCPPCGAPQPPEGGTSGGGTSGGSNSSASTAAERASVEYLQNYVLKPVTLVCAFALR